MSAERATRKLPNKKITLHQSRVGRIDVAGLGMQHEGAWEEGRGGDYMRRMMS